MPTHVMSNGTIASMQGSLVARKRYGLIAARIGSDHTHRMGVATEFNNAGQVIIAQVEDVTRHPKETAEAKWVCRNPNCISKRWDSKAELQADHPEQKIMLGQEEIHLYMAIYERAFKMGMPESKDEKTGKVIPAGPHTPGKLLILSDEE